MSELPDGIPSADEVVPRDSASGVVVRPAAGGGREVLLGLRSRKSRFMPAHLSFPGGGLESEDRPGEAGAHERCAAREVAEETSIQVDPVAWSSAGVRTTPPMFPLRFHTRFFVAEVPAETALPEAPPSPGEIEQVSFERAGSVLDRWTRGECRIPPPALPIFRVLAESDQIPVRELADRIAAANEQEQRAPRIEFSPGTWMLPVRTATLPPATHTNVWMPGGRRFVIIDPGTADENEARRLIEVVGRRRDLGHEVDSIVLTHHHRDHTAGCVSLSATLGLPVRAHPDTLEIVKATATEERALPRFLPVRDGDEIDLDGVVLRAYHTPGHASGHLVFHLLSLGQLVAGDLASGLSTIMIDPVEGDMGLYLASLERARDLECRLLFPGHGPPLPGRTLDRLIVHRKDRERKILEQLQATPSNLGAIATRAYDDVPQMPLALTERQTLSHLLLLEKQGKVKRVDEAGQGWSLV
jgi:glyoxylase-like metal-dependent hydrolase (beta-lactamase superfamily II)/ADP-ribose pyrophosphatase YjhB (NUDIX family)